MKNKGSFILTLSTKAHAGFKNNRSRVYVSTSGYSDAAVKEAIASVSRVEGWTVRHNSLAGYVTITKEQGGRKWLRKLGSP